MRFEKAERRAKVLNATTSVNENITYEARRMNDYNPEDCYVIQFYKGKQVGIAAY